MCDCSKVWKRIGLSNGYQIVGIFELLSQVLWIIVIKKLNHVFFSGIKKFEYCNTKIILKELWNIKKNPCFALYTLAVQKLQLMKFFLKYRNVKLSVIVLLLFLRSRSNCYRPEKIHIVHTYNSECTVQYFQIQIAKIISTQCILLHILNVLY